MRRKNVRHGSECCYHLLVDLLDSSFNLVAVRIRSEERNAGLEKTKKNSERLINGLRFGTEG